MSSLDHRQNSATEQYNNTDSLQLSGSNAQKAPVEQLAFPDNSAVSGNLLTPLSSASADSSTALASQTSAGGPVSLVTRELPEVKTDAFSTASLKGNTKTLRQPVLIRGTGRKSMSLRPPESRHHPVKHAVVTVVLALVVLSALFAVVPLGNNGQSSLLKSIIGGANNQMNITNVKGDNLAAIAQQAATATAVTQDGFDQGAAVYVGVPTAPANMSGSIGSTGSGSTGSVGGSTGSTGSVGSTGSTGGVPVAGGAGFSRFFYGQCTYWANMRYYDLTGHEVPWIGNAYQWTAGAYSYNWMVSTMPRVPSIIVLPPGVQGAGAYGHVAVVESINADGSVVASNWNWAGAWGVTTYVTFTPDAAAGVRFLWY